jgi:hypothetical protein
MRSTLYTAALVAILGGTTTVHAQTLMTAMANRFDFSDNGSITDGTSDSYDGCYTLFVDGTVYVGGVPGVVSGRNITFATESLSGLNVSRVAYVPASGGEYARILDLFENATGAPITVSIAHECNLGSDTSTNVTGSSSGDAVFSTMDQWLTTNDSSSMGDPALGHVVQGPTPRNAVTFAQSMADGLSWRFDSVVVPAGGRVAVLTFAIQQYTPDDDALVRAEAARLATLPSDAVAGVEFLLGDVVNFTPVAECTGTGTACTSGGTAGTCHFGFCCTGCWNGASCQPVGNPAACGIHGAACTNCLDSSTCTVDTCIASTGTCFRVSASPGSACDDGLFCTSTDACNGSGTCVGTGTPCDDVNSCTTDSCVEATDSCNHPAVTDGTTCMAATPGICHVGVCCRGCWDGAACQGGTSPTACGASGGACRSCADGDACSSDFCSLGSCSNPAAPTGTACDDSVYCTSLDRCDGADHCVGSGSACDDGTTCTIDSCDEATHACGHTAVTSACIIGGACYAAGVENPSNPCQICDPARDMASWSANIGILCGAASCTAGALSPAPTCDAAGTCAASAPRPCTTGVCADATTCAAGPLDASTSPDASGVDGGTAGADAAVGVDADTAIGVDADTDGGTRSDATSGGCCGVAGRGRPGGGAVVALLWMVAALARRRRR